MSEQKQETGLVGRGNREGAELFRQWFTELGRTAAEGKGAAYVFVMGSLAELLRSFAAYITPDVVADITQATVEQVGPNRVRLSGVRGHPRPAALKVLAYFDGSDGGAHTWWNPRTVREAAQPDVSADGCTYRYAIPVDTWGVVVSVRGDAESARYSVPTVRAIVPDTWKRLDLELEWGFDAAAAAGDVALSLVLATAVGLGLSLAGVMYPAWVASRMQPVEAMRVEQ